MATANRIYSAGQLKHQVQIQARTAGEDGLGEANGAWANEGGPIFAAVFPVRAAERLQAGAVQETLEIVVIVRYRASITARKRLVWKGQPYDIQGDPVPVDGGTDWLEISAISGVRDGR